MRFVKPRKTKLPGRRQRGFTIIETMIVLAIVAVLILIVFFVVPAARRTARNQDRRQTAGLVESELEAYKNNNQLSLPGTAANATLQAQQQCNFIISNLTGIAGQPTTPVNCTSPPIDGSKDCVFISLQRYDVCFHNWQTSEHDYLGDDNEISIQLGHWCGTDPSSSEYPITSGAASPHDADRYVIWVQMESAPVFCIDNYKD